ncbi:MAG: hypothetical protein AB7O88_28725, partial [Reyranellaceae bacterium]
MSRNRTITPDFWTWEAVIDCAPMTRLLFIGLWNFADDHGVQPLRPRTIRMQVFPGDTIDNDAVRAMIDELASRKLVRIYEVEGVEYLAVVDWSLHHRVSRRARRRYPADPSMPVPEPPPPPAQFPVPADAVEHVPPGAQRDPPRLAPIAQPERWRRMIKNLLRQYWPRDPLIELMDDEAAD